MDLLTEPLCSILNAELNQGFAVATDSSQGLDRLLPYALLL